MSIFLEHKWIARKLNPAGLARIELAVHKAEEITRGEIVPVIVKQSSSIDHVSVILFLFFLLFGISGQLGWAWAFQSDGASNAVYQFIVVVVIVLVSALLTRILSRYDWVARMFTSRRSLVRQTELRAQLEFYRNGIANTEQSTGVLIFVSLLERKVIVLADLGISSKVQPNIWNEVVGLVIDGIKKDDLASGMVNAIGQCGRLLSEFFPKGDDSRNELKNSLRVFDF